MKISQRGIDFIKRWESFAHKPYVCQGGKLTIGYGHVIAPHESFSTISEGEAEALLYADCLVAQKAIDKYVKVALEQHQYDALVSFVFNAGTGNFSTSTLLKHLNNKLYHRVVGEFGRWVFVKKGKEASNGLIKRRTGEALMFNGYKGELQ